MQLSDILRSLSGQNTVVIQGGENPPVAADQQVKQFIEALLPGKVISGEVQEVSGDLLKLLVSQNGEQFSLMARLEQAMELSTGKQLLFQVKNTGENISLSPLYENLAMEKTASHALEQAKLPVNEETLAWTGKLMKEGLPIDKDALTQMNWLVNKYGEERLSDIVDLKKLGFPITQENLEQMSCYKAQTHTLQQGIEELSQQLTDLIREQAAEGKGDSILRLLRQVSEPLQHSEGQQSADVKDIKAVKMVIMEETAENTAWEAPKEEAYASKSAGGRELLKQVAELLQAGERVPFKKAGSAVQFQSALKEFLQQEYLLSPEEMTKDKVKELYVRLGRQLQEMTAALKGTPLEETDFGKNVLQMNRNVDFLNQMNQMYAYIQLPLSMTAGATHGELYVFSGKKRFSGADGEVSALLHLDMEYLGKLDVHVALKAEKVSTRFYMQDEELLDFVEEHMDLLTKRLKERGYDVAVSASLRKEEGNACMRELLKEHSNIPMLSTDSFDARV